MPSSLHLLPPQPQGDNIRFSAILRRPSQPDLTLWWLVPQEWADAVTPWADPFLIGFIFPLMQEGQPLHVQGCVSPSLLANLELFMHIWEKWSPGKYRPIDITADQEIELPPIPTPGATIASFSAGVDSCFTVHRHFHRQAGRRSRHLQAAVVHQGFDVPLQGPGAHFFPALLQKAADMLATLPLPCIPIASNFKDLPVTWKDAWGTQLISGLSLFSARFDAALVANDLPYIRQGLYWALHPVTAPLLGSRGFQVIDDGGEFTRVEKIKAIAPWRQAVDNLHVCFCADTPARHENCCRCEKCVRNILAFRIAGLPRPASFPLDVSPADIKRVRLHTHSLKERWRELAHEAAAAGLAHEPWVKAIHTTLRNNRLRDFRARCQKPFLPLRNQIRQLFRGTTLSKSQRKV